MAVSGGGVRAAVFHLGILGHLAEHQWLELVHYISSVSGGSLAIGLIFSLNNNQWPTNMEYLQKVLPEAKKILTQRNLEKKFISSHLNPLYWSNFLGGRATLLAHSIEKEWGITSAIKELPEKPRWALSCTCYETGKNWRFQRDKMGDFSFGYSIAPDIKLSQAMAASAGFPGLIGPLRLSTKNYVWKNYTTRDRSELKDIHPRQAEVHIWDGGIHDNLGLEALYKPNKGYLKDVDYLIVSDASAPVGIEVRNFPLMFKASRRLVYIAQDQVRSLRSRMVVDHFEKNPGTGVYFRIGNTANDIANKSNVNLDTNGYLENEKVKKAINYKTTLKKMSNDDFELLYRHGYEVAQLTMQAYPFLR